MPTLLSVLYDLSLFAAEKLFGVKAFTQSYPVVMEQGMQDSLPGLVYTQSRTLALPSYVPITNPEEKNNSSLFFVGEDAALHTDPVVAFDVVIRTIPYGSQVHVLKLGGRWAYVRALTCEGWIFKDSLREQVRDVFPVLVDGTSYDAEHEETHKLRKMIHDQFCGDKASLFLTDAEYVTYALSRKGFALPWTDVRPRTPGTWQKKLRGNSGVHIGITPKTNAVMEYVVDDVGYVAFVDAVYPDVSIKQSGVGIVREGVYSEVLMTQEQWKELRPVFISIQ